MDISALFGTVLSSDSINHISQAANVSTSDAQSILRAALPSLLNGALAQSEHSETAASFAGALSQHSAGDTSDLKAFLGTLDMKDGAKIVSHLLGSNASDTVGQIARRSGVSAAEASNVMAAAAPLLMSLLGQQASQNNKDENPANVANMMRVLMKNVDMGSVLSGLLGAGSAGTSGGKKKKKKKNGNALDTLLNLLK